MFSLFEKNIGFDVSDFNVVTGFKFWDRSPDKSSHSKKPKLDLKRFWAAAIAALALHTSVWAEMGFDRSVPVQSNERSGSLVFNEIRETSTNNLLPKANESAVCDYRDIPLSGSSPMSDLNVVIDVHGNKDSATDTGFVVVGGKAIVSPEDAIAALHPAVRDFIGEKGVQRLLAFTKYHDGWDGIGSRGLNENSLLTFERFFGAQDFKPAGMAIFMSSQGNVVTNWLTESGLVEVEFTESGLDFFVEKNNNEGSIERFLFGDFKRKLAAVA